MENNRYYYFVFGSLFDYNNAMCYDLTLRNDCQFINTTHFTSNKFVYFLYKVHQSGIANKFFRIPGQSLWYKYFFDLNKLKKNGGERNFFVFFDSNPWVYDSHFLDYLEKEVPNSTLVLVLVNSMQFRNFRDINYFKAHFRYIYTIDRSDAADYDFSFVEGIHSILPLTVSSYYSDVYFGGANKGREDFLVSVYDILTEKGLRCDFTIVGGTISRNGISNKQLNYTQTLQNQLSSHYILEVCVKEQNANTLRSLEAIMYGKKLITNNKNILKSKYYDPEKIIVFNDIEDLRKMNFQTNMLKVDYGYQGDFSPNKLIEKITKQWENEMK